MKYCMGCMMEMEDHLQVCPHCGYDEASAVQESYYLKPGTVIGGKYIVGRALKYGGYTVKYIGLDAEKDRRVIIGEYLPNDFSTRSQGESMVTIYSGDALDQFQQGLMTYLNEGNRIQQLGDMPGIARVYDCIAENDTGYVISEYLEGKTLKEILDEKTVFKPEEAVSLICNILQGLSRLHPQDIIHCDIAPETIMLTADRKVKLLDFGATRYVTTANSKSLAIILKQGYAPEEQYRSQGQRGPWTDVYALGAVMYRMITGKVPTESVERAFEDDLQEPSKLGIAINSSVENALMNAMNVYQKDRTPSAEAFYRELTSGNTQRIKVKQRKRETGKLPVWAKGLVAVAVCGLIAGGVVLVRQGMENHEKKMVGQEESKFSQNINQTYDTFQKKWKGYGFDIEHVEKEYCYDNTVGDQDMVMEFEDCTKDKSLTEGVSVPKREPEPEKKGQKIAKIVIASRHRVTFQKKWMKNCSKITEGEQRYESRYYPQDGNYQARSYSKPYGMIEKIEYDGENYSPEDIQKKNPLDVSKLYVTVFQGAYYSWPKDPTRNEDYYKGKLVQNILFNYKKGDGKGDGDKNKRALKPDYYRENYLSFRKGDQEGTIVEVLSNSLKNGEKYSQKEDGGELFSVVGTKLTLGRVKVSELDAACKKCHIILKKNGYGDNATVMKVDANLCRYGKTLQITSAVLPATPTPRVTPVPEQNNTYTRPPVQKPPTQPKKPEKPKADPHAM